APTLLLPSPIQVLQTIPGGAPVTYAVMASDAVDGLFASTCTAASGSTFPVGATTVSCFAADSHGNGASGDFVITVTPDTTPPVLDGVPDDQWVEAQGPAGSPVSFTLPTAYDAVY